MRRLGVLAIVLLATLLTPVSPASAVPPALQVADAPLPPSGQCATAPYSYQANPPAGHTEVSVDLSVYNPYDNNVTNVYVDGAAGSGQFNLCNPIAGQYRATIHTFACTPDYESCQSFDGSSAYFYVGERPPPLGPERYQTLLKVTPKVAKRDQVIKFRLTRLYDYGSGELYPMPGVVLLQQKVRGKWKAVPGSRGYTDTGVRRLKYRAPGTRVVVRAKSLRPTIYSKPVTIKPPS